MLNCLNSQAEIFSAYGEDCRQNRKELFTQIFEKKFFFSFTEFIYLIMKHYTSPVFFSVTVVKTFLSELFIVCV